MIIDELIAVIGYDLKGEADLRRFQAGLQGIEKQAVAVGAALSKAAAIAGAAVGAGFGLLGKSIIDTAAQFETFGATLETIEGSAEKAKASLDWIAKFARQTPYEVAELTAAFVKLKAYGIEPMDGTMTVLGDTASAMGKSLNDAVEAFADAASGEFERLKEFGIRSKVEGEKVTFAWDQNGKELTKTVGKSSTEIRKFLADTWGSKFRGAMIRQSKTWSGMMSALKESWTDFLRRIADGGFFENVKRRLASILDTLERWNEDGTIDRAAKMLSDAFTGAADALGVVVERITRHIAFLNQHWDRAKPFVIGFGAALGVLMLRAHPLIALFGAIAAVVEDVMTKLDGGKSVLGGVVDKFSDLGRAVAEAWKSFESFWDSIIKWRNEIVDRFMTLGRDMGDKLLEGLKSKANDIKQWFIDLIPDWAKGYLGIQGGSGAGGGGADAGRGGRGVRTRAGRSSVGYQGRVPLNSTEAAELSAAIKDSAGRLSMDPEDLATLISFETAGTFNKDKAGPTTQHGQHRGYIQWGATQRNQFGVDTARMSPTEQMRKVEEYFWKNGWRKGMSGEQAYATVNAGSPHKTGARDGHNGGTWGTVSDKWRYQMTGHRANARRLMVMGGGSQSPTAAFTGDGNPAATNFQRHQNRMNAIRNSGALPNRTTNQTTNVDAPITVKVEKPGDVPKALQGSMSRAVQAGAGMQPSRMQSGPAQ